MADTGIPSPTPQYQIGRHKVDFAWPEHQVALEFNVDKPEESHHANELRRQGWLVVEADPQDLTDPTPLCGRLRTALRTRTRIAA
jgi:hypothetical protein